jgi:hypothetical protein
MVTGYFQTGRREEKDEGNRKGRCSSRSIHGRVETGKRGSMKELMKLCKLKISSCAQLHSASILRRDLRQHATVIQPGSSGPEEPVNYRSLPEQKLLIWRLAFTNFALYVRL